MDFKRAKKTAKRIRRERTLLLVYAVAVTAALLISIYHNNSVRASVSYDDELIDVMPEEVALEENAYSLEDNLGFMESENLPVETMEELPEEKAIQPATDLIGTQTLGVNEEAVVVDKGDSFINILTKMGLEYAEATNIYTAYKKVYDARKIKVGQILNISSMVDGNYPDVISITKIMTEPVSGTRYIVEKKDGKYEARVEQDDLTTEVKSFSGVIKGTLSGSMKTAGVPQNIIGRFTNIFSFSVDFRRDVKAGDKFEVRYEVRVAPDGKVVNTGDIVYAALLLGKTKTALYRFKDKSGNIDYYDEKGLALKKTLDRKPLEFRNARISSRFGRRFHPILKKYHPHHGVDYAAPMNTKVYAAGDGVVTSAKWVNGYGNYITIRHNSEYSTGYAHLKSYASGIRPGVRVRQGQVIAYVGSTGRSTGPHLHFEVIKNGQKVDPLKIKAATGENLSGAQLKEFKKMVEQIKAESHAETKVAEKK